MMNSNPTLNTSIRDLNFFRPFGLDILCITRKYLVLNIVQRNLKIKYRRSIVGVFWSALLPVLNAMLYFVVFKYFLKVGIPNYFVFIISGLLPWTFFSLTVSDSMESLINNQGLLSKVPVPVQVFPFATALTNFVHLILSLPVILGSMLIFHLKFSPSLLLLPYFLLMLFLLGYACGLISSLIFVYLRDLRHLMVVSLQAWFYLTPILYDDHVLTGNWRILLSVNPVACIFVGIRRVVLEAHPPNMNIMILSIAWPVITIFIAMILLKKFSRNVVESI